MVTTLVGLACKRFDKTAGFGDFDACEFHCRNAAPAGIAQRRSGDRPRGGEVVANEAGAAPHRSATL